MIHSKVLRDSIVLSLKRYIAGIIDLVSAILFILAIEIPISFVFIEFGLFNEYEIRTSIAVINPLLILILLGLWTSSFFNGKSLGCKLLKLRVISSKSSIISVIGCILRYFLLLGPTYIYIVFYIKPYIESSDFLKPPLLGLYFLFWLIFFFPISILWGRGQQGIHDAILNIRITQKDFYRDGYSRLSVFGSILATSIISILLVLGIQNSSLLRRTMSYFNPIKAHMKGYFPKLKTESENIDRIIKEVVAMLQQSSFRDQVKNIYFGFATTVKPEVFQEKGITIPPGTIIPTITLNMRGIKIINPNIFFTKEVIKRIQLLLVDYQYFCLRCVTGVNLITFRYATEGVCIYNKNYIEPLDCSGGLKPEFLLIEWYGPNKIR